MALNYRVLKTKTTHIVWFIILTGLIVFTGFMREEIFYQVNSYIKYLEGYPINYTHPGFVPFFEGNTVAQLITYKWIWTIEFTVVYYLLGVVTFIALFRNYKMIYYLTILYAGLVVLSAVSYGLGHMIEGTELGYRIARIFMGFLQSPVPLLVLVPGIYLVDGKGYSR